MTASMPHMSLIKPIPFLPPPQRNGEFTIHRDGFDASHQANGGQKEQTHCHSCPPGHGHYQRSQRHSCQCDHSSRVHNTIHRQHSAGATQCVSVTYRTNSRMLHPVVHTNALILTGCEQHRQIRRGQPHAYSAQLYSAAVRLHCLPAPRRLGGSIAEQNSACIAFELLDGSAQHL